jgi:hypothetical protein
MSAPLSSVALDTRPVPFPLTRFSAFIDVCAVTLAVFVANFPDKEEV